MKKSLKKLIPTGMRYTVEEMTPVKAKRFLKRNTANYRKMKPRIVSRYADAMRKGEWRFTHQSIAVSVKGILLDGQHRLQAIVDSGVTILMVVCWNAPDGSRYESDTGVVRTNVDFVDGVLKLEGASRITPICTSIQELVTNTKQRVSTKRIEELIEDYREGMNDCLPFFTGVKGISQSAIIAACVYAHRFYPEKAKEFAQSLGSLAYKANSPEHSVARYVNSTECRSNRRRTTMLCVLQAFVCYLHGDAGPKRLEPKDDTLKFFKSGSHLKLVKKAA
jgi:hypothetical protein